MLGNPKITPEVRRIVVDGVMKQVDGRSIEQLEADRDEMLMGLLESGSHHAQRAAVAMRLVPGEFHRRFIDRVMQGARAEGAEVDVDPETPDIGALETRVSGLAATISHVRRHHLELELQMPKFSAPLRTLVAITVTSRALMEPLSSPM